MGCQVLSSKRSNATTGLGFGDRFNYDFVKRARDQPAPGEYAADKSCGKQINSGKKSLPLYSFGHSTRDGAKRVYISADHEKAVYGVDSPGPMTANSVRSLPASLLTRLPACRRVAPHVWDPATWQQTSDLRGVSAHVGTIAVTPSQLHEVLSMWRPGRQQGGPCPAGS